MTLDQLRPGQRAAVLAVGGSGARRRHLLEMGLTPGAEIMLQKAAPLGDPIQLTVRGYALTLRLDDARGIVLGPSQTCNDGGALVFPKRRIPDPLGKPLPEGAPQRLALIGNQNCGKTTLFNQLTGANQHVGNFPGVTVERRDGSIRSYPEVTITDLPGLYSLFPYSGEERVASAFLRDERPDGIINIVDATNLTRNLYLTVQLLALGIPMVLALNMMDEVRANGGAVDLHALESALGIPVVPISAAKHEGIDALVAQTLRVTRERRVPAPLDFSAEEQASGLDPEAAQASARFNFLEQLCRRAVVQPRESREHRRSRQIDRWLTGRYTALPCFLGIMTFTFAMTFGGIGAWLSHGMEALVAGGIGLLDRALTHAGIHAVLHSLLIDGMAGGVGSVLAFLPTIVTLFLFLSILEDTGYMARVAFIMDRPLRGLGLSGRSFVPLLMGFGCSVPAIMATRTLSSERDRRMTLLLLPFMSCSAKLPIYALLVGAFFPVPYRVPLTAGLYGLGILCGCLYAALLRRTWFKGEAVPFVMELPTYRLPSLKSVLRLIGDKAQGFLQKAFTLILLASVCIWFLQTFDAHFQRAASPEESLLAALGGLFAPLFTPLGFGDWRVSTALIAGLAAKESVVSTMTLLLGGDVSRLSTLFTPFTALVFLVFTLLYTPCAAAVATVRRELGSVRSAVCVALLQCGIAWAMAFAVRCVGLLLGFT